MTTPHLRPRRAGSHPVPSGTPSAWPCAIDSPSAFSAAADATLPVLQRYARRLDAGNWEDLVQETLARAWRARAQFQAGSNVKAWLFTILRHAFWSGARRASRQVEWSDHLADRATCPADQEDGLLQADLSAAVAALPGGQRDALLAVTEGELSYLDAAARLGIPLTTLRSRIFRARAAVVAFLERGDPRVEAGLLYNGFRR